MMKSDPESRYVVKIQDGELVHRRSDGAIERVSLAGIRRVFVETNDSGPCGMDVWWIVEGSSEQERCGFPQGASGEEAAIRELSKLPGFRIRGMNSTENRCFECWPDPDQPSSV